MDELFAAILVKFNASVLAAYHLYFEEAPQDAAMPYMTYILVSNEPVETFTETSESSLIQFSVWDNTPSALTVTQIGEQLKAVYDWCHLTVAGRVHISMARQAERLVRDTDGGWQYSVDYRTEIS